MTNIPNNSLLQNIINDTNNHGYLTEAGCQQVTRYLQRVANFSGEYPTTDAERSAQPLRQILIPLALLEDLLREAYDKGYQTAASY